MNEISILLMLAMAAAFAAALVLVLRKAKRGGGCCGEHEEAVQLRRKADRNHRHYPHRMTMEIGGMTCENCARRVQNALNTVDGVLASVRIDTKTADIRLKQMPAEEELRALREAVRSAGYTVLNTRREY